MVTEVDTECIDHHCLPMNKASQALPLLSLCMRTEQRGRRLGTRLTVHSTYLPSSTTFHCELLRTPHSVATSVTSLRHSATNPSIAMAMGTGWLVELSKNCEMCFSISSPCTSALYEHIHLKRYTELSMVWKLQRYEGNCHLTRDEFTSTVPSMQQPLLAC